MRGSLALLVVPLLVAGCGGVQVERTPDLPAPRRIAVLPITGDATVRERQALRTLLREQLRVRSLAVAENGHVDRVLSEQRDMLDPEQFALPDTGLSADRIRSLCATLGVDGLLWSTDFEASRLRLPLYRRRKISATWQIYDRDGRAYWRASYSRGRSGGFLADTGQLFRAVAAEVEGDGDGQFQRLAASYLDDVLDTLPELPADGYPEHGEPAISSVESTVRRAGESDVIEVRIRATPGALVRFDLGPRLTGLPTRETAPGDYRGLYRRTPGDGTDGAQGVTARIQDVYGHDGAAAEPAAMREVSES